MPSAIAFLPWVYVDEVREVGSVRFLPYLRGSLPGDLAGMSQRDMDGVLSAYADLPGQPVRRAAILELDNWRTGSDAEVVVSRLFRAKECITAAALAHRRLFRGHFDYCNSDTYALMVQRYQAGSTDTFAFWTRRRDGGTRSLWSSEEFAFHRSNHVAAQARVTLDESLLSALLRLPADYDWLHEAVREFNHANTDSPDIPEHVELVMVKSALEWLLGARTDRKSMNDQLMKLINSLLPEELWPDRPSATRWRDRYPKAERPLGAWLTEFCGIRGASAHGGDRKRPTWLWTEHEHLAFGAILFPLLLKLALVREGFLQMDRWDLERLRRIELRLEHDPFSNAANQLGQTHPWDDLDARAKIHAHLAAKPVRWPDPPSC